MGNEHETFNLVLIGTAFALMFIFGWMNNVMLVGLVAGATLSTVSVSESKHRRKTSSQSKPAVHEALSYNNFEMQHNSVIGDDERDDG